MNMTISESDRKLLGFLAAFLVAALFFFLVFKPLSAKREQIDVELRNAKTQEADMDNKAAMAEDMAKQEEDVSAQMKQVLARFYPVLQSQEAERMATTLMLNHNLSIQSLTVTMPEKSAELDWYQYSPNAVAYGQPASGEKAQAALSLYAARVICVADGSKEDLWALIDDISAGYPAISITSIEWSSTQRVVENAVKPVAVETDENGEEVQVMQAEPVTETTDRLTIGLEIYMCNQ